MVQFLVEVFTTIIFRINNMKKIFLSILSVAVFISSIHAQTCSTTNTFNGTGTTAFTVSDPNGNVGGTISTANGIQLLNGSGTTGVLGSRECRAYTGLSTLDNTRFSAECTVSLTAGNSPTHSPMAFTAGTLEFAYAASACPDQTTQNPCSYASSNQSSIVVYIADPAAPAVSDIVTNGTAIVVYTKVGNAGHVQACTAIPIPASAIGNFKVRFERISSTQGRLSYVNAATNEVVKASCVTIPATITGLNTLQAGVQTSSSPQRTLTGVFNDYKIYNTCNILTLPAPAAGSVGTICAGTTATITASTLTDSPVFSWFTVSTGGTAVATGASYTTPALSATATYYVSYADACGQVSPRTAVTVPVNNITVAPIIGKISVCKNQIIALECATPGGVWSSSDVTKATVKQTGVVTGIAVGTVTISYTVTSGACSKTVSIVLTVDDVVTFIIVGPSPVCPGTTGNAYYVSPSVAGADYTWNVQDGPEVGVNFPVNGSINTNLTIPAAVAGNQFILRCQGLNACGASALITKTIAVSTLVPPAPDVNCSSGCANLVVTNYGTNTIEWIVGGVVQSTAASFVQPLGTSVLCTYTNPVSGCKKSTWYSPAVVCTYTQRIANTETYTDFQLKVYPNPNSGDFTFITKGYAGKAIVLNALGQVIEEIKVEATKIQYEISLGDKSKGTYILRLIGDEENHVSVFVIE